MMHFQSGKILTEQGSSKSITACLAIPSFSNSGAASVSVKGQSVCSSGITKRSFRLLNVFEGPSQNENYTTCFIASRRYLADIN